MPISVDLIQKTVADYYDIRLSDITGKKRSKDIVWPRQIAMHLSRTLTKNSFPSIGKSLIEIMRLFYMPMNKLIAKQLKIDDLNRH